jgi:hypothetical protein
VRLIREVSVGFALAVALVTLMFNHVAEVAAAQDERTIIDFEDAPSGRSGTPVSEFTDFYEPVGLEFVRPVTALIFDEASIPALANFARSGSTVITDCYAEEFCANRIEIAFAQRHRRLELWVGFGSALNESANVVLEGFGADGRLLSSDSVGLGPSDEAIPIRVPLVVSDPAGQIVGVVLRWEEPERFLSDLALDDIELTPAILGGLAEPVDTPEPNGADPTDTSETTDTSDAIDTSDENDLIPTDTEDGSEGQNGSGLWLVGIVVLIFVGGAAVYGVRRTSRKAPRTDPTVNARVTVRIQHDPGTQQVLDLDGPVVVIRAAMPPGRGSTTIQEGETS